MITALRDHRPEVTGFDDVVIDTPPAIGLLTLAAADQVVVSLACETESFDQPQRLAVAIDARVAPRLRPGAETGGIVPTRRDGRKRLDCEGVELLHERYPAGRVVYPVRQAVAARDACSADMPVSISAPTSAIAGDYAAARAPCSTGRTAPGAPRRDDERCDTADSVDRLPAPSPPAAPRTAASPTRTAAAAGPGTRHLGICYHPADFTDAKSAHLAAWRAGGTADTFATWIAAVLVDHVQPDPAQRAAVTLPSHTGGGGSTRSSTLPGSVHEAVRAAVVVEQNAGGTLPAPPARLPNRLQR